MVSLEGFSEVAPRQRRSRSIESSSTSSVAEKIRRVEEQSSCYVESDAKVSSRTKNNPTKSFGEKSDAFWSLASKSPRTSKKLLPIETIKTKQSGSNDDSSNTAFEIAMGDVTSQDVITKHSKAGKRIKRKKDQNSSNEFDRSAETVSSDDTRSTSKSGSVRRIRKTKKNKKFTSVGSKDTSAGDGSGCASADSKCMTSKNDMKSSLRRREPITSPAPNPNSPSLVSQDVISSQPSSPKKIHQRLLNRAVSSPTLTSPNEILKKKISVTCSSMTDRLPTELSPHCNCNNNSSSNFTHKSHNSTENKLSPWKQVNTSPPDAHASPKDPQRGRSSLPEPPLLTNNDKTTETTPATKKSTSTKDKLPSTKRLKAPQRKRSGSPRTPKRGISRAVSSPGLTSPNKASKKKPTARPNLATVTYTPRMKKHPLHPPPPLPSRGLSRALSSPILASPSPARKSDQPAPGPSTTVADRGTVKIADKDNYGRPKKHKPISRRGVLQQSTGSVQRIVTKRSSSSDDAVNRKAIGSTAIEVEPIRKVSLFPKSGRHLERNLSVASLQESPSSIGRPVPQARGVKRYSSAPTTSSNRTIVSNEGNHCFLRSIKEDESDHSSPITSKPRPVSMRSPPSTSLGANTDKRILQSLQNPLEVEAVPLTSTPSPDRRVGYNRTQSVPILDGRRYNRPLRGRPKTPVSTINEFPPPSRPRIGRTRSDDVSSLALSLHEQPVKAKRCSSFDEPCRVKPQGILKNSSHHASSNIHMRNSSSPPPKQGAKKNFVTDVGFASSADVYYASSDDDDDFSVEEEVIQFEPKPKMTPLQARPGLQQSNSSGSGLNLSIHSFMTTRSLLSIDKEQFENDTQWKQILRFMKLLPPHKDENPLKRRIRIFTWLVLLCDFLAAMVAVTKYDGATTCCGEPIFSLLINLNWDTLFRVITYLYLVLIIAEVIPVIRQGLPLNILNPALGFVITFAMFFDDSVAEAVAMWIIEAMSIFFDFLAYRVKARVYREEMARLDQTDAELAELTKSRRASRRWSRHHSTRSSKPRSSHGSQHSHEFSTVEEGDDDGSSVSVDSFGGNDSTQDLEHMEETFKESGEGYDLDASTKESNGTSSREQSCRKNSPATSKTVDLMGRSGHESLASTTSRIPKVGERREMRLLRERRVLRNKRQSEAIELKIHFIGTCMNVSFVGVSLILIITISSTGGLCVFDEKVKIFSMDQLGNCKGCVGATDVCEVCNADGSYQCYYPYY
jgi:hypothetical protein